MLNRLFPKALTVVRHCLGVRSGEDVLILSDDTLSTDLVTAFRLAAADAGAHTSLLTYAPLSHHHISRHCRFAGASLRQETMRLSPAVTAALSAADAAIVLNSDLELLFVPAIRELFVHPGQGTASQGVRVVAMVMLSADAAFHLLPESSEEVELVRAATEEGGRLMAGASQARITSAAGTDLSLRLGRYRVMLHLGVAGPRSLQLLPAGQVLRVPDDGSAEGTFVVDRTISAYDYKVLQEPITFVVKRGMVTDIQGGLEAARMRRFLDSFGDPNMYHVTELAFGANPRCRLTGVAPPTGDTHTAGCVSLALGTDVHLGGAVRSHAHCDMTMEAATLELDGQAVIRQGRLLIGASPDAVTQ